MSSPSSRCARAAFGTVVAVAAAAVTVGSLSTAPAQATEPPSSPSAAPTASDSGWYSPTPSVTSAPESLVSSVGRREPARVVSVVAGPDGPVVATEQTRGRQQAEAAIAAAQDDPDLLAVGLDSKVRLVGSPAPAKTAATSDPLRKHQWGMDALDVEAAWPTSQGKGVVVAVVDSGVNGSHPDLAPAMVRGVNTRTDSGDHSSPAQDRAGHGTHVAGIIAARAGNGTGVVGVAPQARIMPVKVLDADGTGWMSDVVEGMRWAVDHGASVINLSLGGTAADFMEAVVGYALDRGVTVVAAAGNEGSHHPSYPAAFPGVISVAALDPSGRIADYSNYGRTIDLAAPGTNIMSTIGRGHDELSGTSMATPHVAGVAALVRAAHPTAEVAGVLMDTARDLGASGRDNRYGHGRVDPVAALRAVCATGTCTYRPAPAPSLRQQSLQRLSAVRLGKRRKLPATTRQGARISAWRATNDKCSARQRAGGWVLAGRARGTCRLLVKAGPTSGYAPLTELTKVRVVGRR